MLAPVRTVAPSQNLLNPEEVKAHLRIDHADEDVLISGFIEAATAYVDGYTGILGLALLTQTWSVGFPAFKNRLDIPLGPVQSATIEYYDSTNALQVLPSSVYTVLSDGAGPYVGLRYNQQWPQTYTRDDAVKITWVAGYGTTPASVPESIRTAMLLLIGQWYRNRSGIVDAGSTAELPFAVTGLLFPFRRVQV